MIVKRELIPKLYLRCQYLKNRGMAMYKILLVEDEQIVRVALKSLIDWNANGFEMPLEARNGEEGLEILLNESIDLVMTDINMPVMDGITFIKHINKMDHKPLIIVLSAYNDYNLVRDAFRMGIYDYISKTEMEPEQITAILKEAFVHREKMELAIEGHSKKKHELETIKNKLIWESGPEIKLSDIVNNVQVGSRIVVCTLLVDDYAIIRQRYINGSVNELAQNMTETIQNSIEGNDGLLLIPIDGEKYVLLCMFDLTKEYEIYSEVEKLLLRLRNQLITYMNIDITVGISSIFGINDDIKTIYRESSTNANYRYLLGKGKNIYPLNVSQIDFHKKESIIKDIDSLILAIQDKKQEEVKHTLQSILDKISFFDCSEQETLGYYLELLYLIIHSFHELEERTVNIFEHSTNFLSILECFDTKLEIDNWFHNLVDNIMNYVYSTSNDSQPIQKAKEYIYKHYHEKISLSSVSELLGISEGYLSVLFSQETGEKFITFLTRVRIEEAKKILVSSNLKIYEVADAVGYENVEHFSRVFKKYVGMSPVQFRK